MIRAEDLIWLEQYFNSATGWMHWLWCGLICSVIAIQRFDQCPLYIGNDFWHRLTGDKQFYGDLRIAITEVAMAADGAQILNDTINKLAATDEIKQIARASSK